jgi:hypothetical protein
MVSPFHDFEVVRAVVLISVDAPFSFQVIEPSGHKTRSIIVEGIKKAGEQSRRGAKPPGIVRDGP